MSVLSKCGIGLAVTAGATIVFGPTLCGLVDAGWWFLTGHQLTSIPWTDGRKVYAASAWLLLPLIAMSVALG